MAVVIAALCFKALIPVGTMLTHVDKVLTVAICDGTAGNHAVRDIVIPTKSKPAGEDRQQACAFAALGMAYTGAVDPALLVLALAFIMALAFAPLPQRRLQRAERLRPPLRAPPHTA